MSTLMHTVFMNGWQLPVERRVENLAGDLGCNKINVYTSANEHSYSQVVSEKVTTALCKQACLPMPLTSSVYPGCDQSITHAARHVVLFLRA